jgi:SAM-dependent methyltransferase
MKTGGSNTIWHDVECGSYVADLPLWEELADHTGGRILELGCGTGRVTLHLARRGAPLVIGIERDAELVATLWERRGRLSADAEYLDVLDFDLAGDFDLVLAPMQLIQLLGGRDERIDCLFRVTEHLTSSGIAAFAIVEDLALAPVAGTAPPLPDVAQIEGWIYSSQPLDVVSDGESIVIRRLRQTVSPTGELRDEVNEVVLCPLSAETLESEAAEAGLRPAGRQTIPATEAHVGSTVVLLERGG